MQQKGVTKPHLEIVLFCKKFVDILFQMPPDEEIILRDSSFFDAKGQLIISIPSIDENE